MALRPVSELGLQEVTDIAAPGTAKPAAAPAQKPARPAVRRRAAATRPAPAKRPSARPKRKRSGASAPPAPPEPTPRATHAGRGRSVAAGVGTPILSGAVGVAGSFLLARAVLRRGRG